MSPVVVLGEGLPRRATPSGAVDPFFWLDLDNAEQMVNALTAALASADPSTRPPSTRLGTPTSPT